MAVSDTIAPETKERASRIGEADLVIALPSCHSRELLDAAVAALRPVLQDLLPDRKAVILHPETAKPSTEESNEPAAPNALLPLVSLPAISRGAVSGTAGRSRTSLAVASGKCAGRARQRHDEFGSDFIDSGGLARIGGAGAESWF